ncbi:MAG: OsmC family protein [Chloroflexi bacterium]|nr:OsmC family protein [Chloroflexota bacterium]
MGQIQVSWLENLTFVGTDSTNHSVVLSSAGDGVGMKPSELLMVSLGSCTGYDVINIMTKKREQISGLKITVSGEQLADPPWTFTKIHTHYQVTGKGLTEKSVADAVHLSKEKYCSVANTLAGSVEMTFDWEVIEAE